MTPEVKGGGETIHVALSVDVDRFPDSRLVLYVRGARGWSPRLAHVFTVEDLRAACALARGAGLVVFPPCDRTNQDGSCAGHQETP